MKRHFLRNGALIAAALLALGCPHDKYTVELAVDEGGGLHRKLTVKGVEQNVSVETLTLVGKAYGKPPATAEAEEATFEGTFKEKTPDDVGGRGTVFAFPSTLGTACAYLETFRGNDSAAAIAEARLKAIDHGVDLLRGWFRQEFGAREGFAELDRFLDGDFRRDLKDVAEYFYRLITSDEHPYRMMAPGEKEKLAKAGMAENILRAIQFLVNRGYLTPALVSKALQIAADVDKRDIQRDLFEHILRVKAGVKDAEGFARAIVELLNDNSRAEKSFARYYLATEEGKTVAKEDRPKTRASIERVERLLAPFDFDIFNSNDELEMSLALPIKPYETNGVWDEAAGRVRWAGEIRGRRATQYRLPAICYAAWSVPDAGAQTALFGSVALTGKELMGYASWLNSLSAARAEAWNAMLKTTSRARQDALREFRFEGDDTPAVSKYPAARTIYNLLTGEDPTRDD